MPALSPPANLGDLLKYEAPNLYSREHQTVAAGHDLALGTIVGRTANGILAPLDPTATDGSERAIGVLGEAVDTRFMVRDALLIARHAILASQHLRWPDGVTPDQRATALAHLADQGILVRDSV